MPISPNFPPPNAANDSPPYAPNDSPPYAPNDSPPYAPNSNDSVLSGGQANIFEDPNMNAFFNRLPGDKQSTILLLEPGQREIVLNTLIQRSARQEAMGQQYMTGLNTNQMNSNNDSELTNFFTRLPVKNQLGALKNEYGNLSKDFNKLGGAVEKPLITIKTPEDPTEKIYKELSLLKPTDSGEDKKEKESNKMDTNTNTSNNETSSSGGGLKIVKI